jgi:hypothetical protein
MPQVELAAHKFGSNVAEQIVQVRPTAIGHRPRAACCSSA